MSFNFVKKQAEYIKKKKKKKKKKERREIKFKIYLY